MDSTVLKRCPHHKLPSLDLDIPLGQDIFYSLRELLGGTCRKQNFTRKIKAQACALPADRHPLEEAQRAFSIIIGYTYTFESMV